MRSAATEPGRVAPRGAELPSRAAGASGRGHRPGDRRGRRPPRGDTPRLCSVVAVLIVTVVRAAPPPTPLPDRPYLGWSSWTLEATTDPAYGGMRWLTADHVTQQADAMRRLLGPHGYTYVNLDSGWSAGFDDAGRPTADSAKFPAGLATLAAHLHGQGQRLGLYVNPGIPGDLFRRNPVVAGTTVHVRDLCFHPRQPATAWRTNHRVDFARPAAQAYVDSVAKRFAEWGVDFVKLDGVTPGSDVTDPAIDSRDDVAAWSAALAQCGRPVWLTVSWHVDHGAADFWRRHAQAWRIEGDVEQYGPRLANWDSVRKRFDAAAAWAADAGVGRGYNDLDSLVVGNGRADGLSDDQRRTTATLWAIGGSPLYAGDDLTKLDPLGLELFTNDEVIAIDQAGRPATPLTRQVWHADLGDGSHAVALFNRDGHAATVSLRWADLHLRPTAVRDVWAHADLPVDGDGFTAKLPPDGCRLLRVRATAR